MTDKLSIWNGALTRVGERRLASLTENREPRRVLDGVWDDGFVDKILIAGQWKFATRVAEVEYDAGIEPDFGFRYGFAKPDDFVRTCAISADEYFKQPLLEYNDNAGYWYADLQTIYVKWVSNGDDYGNDLTLWPANFAEFAEWALAEKIVKRLTQSETGLQDARKELQKARTMALSTDAQAEPTKFPPTGSWVGARGGGRRGGRRTDGGWV